jgi:hypothetical protein
VCNPEAADGTQNNKNLFLAGHFLSSDPSIVVYRGGLGGVWTLLGGYERVWGGRPFSGERVGVVPLFQLEERKY